MIDPGGVRNSIRPGTRPRLPHPPRLGPRDRPIRTPQPAIGRPHHPLGRLKKGQESSSDALSVPSDGQNEPSDAVDPSSDAEDPPSDAEESPSDGVLEGNERVSVPKVEKVSKKGTVYLATPHVPQAL